MESTFLTRAEFYKLFDFLRSETPAELVWLREYFSKKLLITLDVTLTLPQMKEQLFLQYQTNNSSVEATVFIKSFAVKMYKAHKARLYRKKLGAKKMLNVAITPKHMQNLELICTFQDIQKNKFIEMMIEGSHHHLIDSKTKLKIEKLQNKLILEQTRDSKKLEGITSNSQIEKEALDRLQNKTEEQELTIEKLKENISSMFEVIRKSQHNNIPINGYSYDDASIIYYNSIQK
ncbi:hypothetical protein BEL05_02675 [Shewanella colwelliana]|uniref:Uncharacterized protein n=1 Tax=Shewanella colwelliana TaxID=23 RepID=A0A1E5IYF3_SHECO|nr:hypothetical protein [Shewanella colwelliana]OEG75178.1 hypothetical protein BEL05_02675 [Shewanella colwelliana]